MGAMIAFGCTPKEGDCPDILEIRLTCNLPLI
jgi:hypothetical protein